MSLKKIVPFLFVCLIAVLIGCFNEGDIKPEVETDQMEFKAIDDGPIVIQECQASILPLCDCKITVLNIENNSADWSISAYNVGGNNHRCCVNGSWKSNLSFGSGCGSGDNEVGIPQFLTCGLNPGNFGLLFSSKNCNDNCEYQPNNVMVQLDCGGTKRTFYMAANQNEECNEGVGSFVLSVDGECNL